MRVVDYILPRVHLFGAMSDAEGIKTSWRQTTRLALAITLHNIPKDWRLASRAGSRSRGAARLSDRVFSKKAPSDLLIEQPVAILGEYRGRPHRFVHRQPDEPAEQQVVIELLHQQPLAANRVEDLKQLRPQQTLGPRAGP